MDPTQRFSSKAQVYARYRPNFTPQAIAALKAVTDLPRKSRVMDVGAGTGMLTRHLLGHFASVWALGPNPDMLAVAAADMRDFSGFRPLAARAEAIPMASASVNLITAGRAIHWFQPEPARAEFRRIAKPGAWLAIAYQRMIDEVFREAVRELRTPENGFLTRDDDPSPGDVPFEYFFAGNQYQTLTFLHTHQQTFDAFLGGLQSGSSAPDEDHPLFDNFRQAALKIFERFSPDGLMELQISTEIHFGKVR